MRVLPIAIGVLLLAACHNQPKQSANESVAAEQPTGPIKGVDRTHRGQPAPDVTFNDPDGEQTSLAELSGKPTLVNLWATWCAPCVKELPTLGRLAKAHEKDGALQVIAISQDSGPHPSVVAFLDSKAPELAPYQDSTMALSGKLGAEVLPTSILFDAKGREVWRYVGDLDWTSAEAAKLLSEANASKGS
jgi:thiol-disulfide isomerase/thioredoxin